MAVAFRLLTPLEHRRLPRWDAPVRATGARSTVAGVLICLAGVALVLLAKNGLTGFAGLVTLGCFLASAAAARVCASSVPRSPGQVVAGSNPVSPTEENRL
jgi:hypothetical protein